MLTMSEVGEAIPLNRPQEVNTTARDNKMYIFESIKTKTKPSMYQVSVVIVGKNLGLEPMAGRATFNAQFYEFPGRLEVGGLFLPFIRYIMREG